MENSTAKETLGKMRSLMERMEMPTHTAYEGMLNESMNINEATSSNRVQVTRDEIFDLLDKGDTTANAAGKFASVTYVEAVDVYKTKKNWRSDDVSAALDSNKERSEEDWYKSINDYNQDGAKGKNPVTTIIATKRYVFNWLDKDALDKKYSQLKNDKENLRMKHGLPTEFSNPNNAKVKTDYGVDFTSKGNAMRSFNLFGVRPKTTTYLTDANGNIVTQVPKDIVYAMKAPAKNFDPYAIEKYVSDTLQGPALDSYKSEYKDIMDKYRIQWKDLLHDKILCIALSVGGTSYYYINDKVILAIAKNSDTNVNQEQLLKIAEEQLGETFNAIQGFAN